MFEADRLEERARASKLTIRVLKSHEAPPSLQMPPGTQSQMVAFVDPDGTYLAEAHRYLLPDGRLGASGRHDPKALRRGGVVYKPWWGTTLGEHRAGR